MPVVNADPHELRYACVRDLRALILALDPYFEGRLERPHQVLIDALMAFRRGRPVTLMDGTVVDPAGYDGFLNFFSRDTWKSTIVCEFFPIWLCLYWLMDPSKPQRPPAILIFQAKLDKAILHLKKIKRLMCSEPFTALFPELVPGHRDPEKWDTQSYLNLSGCDRGGAKENCIEIASVTASYTGWHVTDKVTDDPVTEENYSSAVEQEKIKDGIRINDNILDSEHGRSYFVGTPYSVFDANMALRNGEMGRMLEVSASAFAQTPAAFFTWAKMVPDSEESTSMRAEVEAAYTLNFPKRLPLDILAAKFRKQGSRFFSSQQLLDIRDEGKAIFRAEWFENALVGRDEAQKRVVGVPVMLVDSAWKKPHNKHTGDDTAIGIVGYDKDGDPYLLDLYVSDTATELEGMKVMASMIKRHKVRRIVKETFGEDQFVSRWRDWCKSEGHTYVPVSIPERTRSVQGKSSRIRQLAPYFEMGRFFIVESLAYIDKLRKQYIQYAGEGSGKDDILDMLADAIMTEVRPVVMPPWSQLRWRAPSIGGSVSAPMATGDGGKWASMRGRIV